MRCQQENVANQHACQVQRDLGQLEQTHTFFFNKQTDFRIGNPEIKADTDPLIPGQTSLNLPAEQIPESCLERDLGLYPSSDTMILCDLS